MGGGGTRTMGAAPKYDGQAAARRWFCAPECKTPRKMRGVEFFFG